jgi:hypothetical protein
MQHVVAVPSLYMLDPKRTIAVSLVPFVQKKKEGPYQSIKERHAYLKHRTKMERTKQGVKART